VAILGEKIELYLKGSEVDIRINKF